MADLAMEIERIVREVLAGLRGRWPQVPYAQRRPEPKQGRGKRKGDRKGGPCRGRDPPPLISLADLPERMAGDSPPGRAARGPWLRPRFATNCSEGTFALAYGEAETAETKQRIKVDLVAMGAKLDPGPLARVWRTKGTEVAIDRMQLPDCRKRTAGCRFSSREDPGRAAFQAHVRRASAWPTVTRECERSWEREPMRSMPTRQRRRQPVGGRSHRRRALFATRQMAIRFLRGRPAASAPEVFREKLG